MPCFFCASRQQVKPTDDRSNFLSSDSHVFITIKNNRVFHLIHLDKKKAGNASVVQTAQPIHASHDKWTDQLNQHEDKTKQYDSKHAFRHNFKLVENFDSTGSSVIYRDKIRLEEPSKDPEPLPLLFFIHGVGGNAKIWLNQLEYFYNQNYEIIAIDLLGHGQSGRSSDRTNFEFKEMAMDVVFIFDMFSKAKNVVIGHSYGCSFATFLTQCRPEVVTKLVLISGGSPHPLDFKSTFLSFPLCLIRLIQPMINCHFFCKAFSSYCNKPEYASEAFNVSSKTLLYMMGGQIWLEATVQYHRTLKQPTLLIEGEVDKLVPLEDALDMIDVIKHGYLVVLKNGSHMIIIEQHESINNLISLFLNDDFR